MESAHASRQGQERAGQGHAAAGHGGRCKAWQGQGKAG